MKWIATLLALFLLAVTGSPVAAQIAGEASGNMRTVSTESWVEEWDASQGRWVKVADTGEGYDAGLTITTTIVNGEIVSQDYAEARSAARFARPSVAANAAPMLAQYGPFLVTGAATARMIGATDSHSPRHFEAMLRDFPQISLLEMVEAPGTSNDLANLEVGRQIRAAGIATHVPQGGSVRSGAVELFLAGATRTLEDGAQFAVHSWLDNYGREADDFAPEHPAHRLYLDYYVEMGMSEERARAFYEMTNSVPHSGALWLRAEDMRPWIAEDRVQPRIAARQIALAPVSEAIDLALSLIEQDMVAAQAEDSAPALAYDDLSAVTLARLEMAGPRL